MQKIFLAWFQFNSKIRQLAAYWRTLFYVLKYNRVFQISSVFNFPFFLYFRLVTSLIFVTGQLWETTRQRLVTIYTTAYIEHLATVSRLYTFVFIF